MCRSCPPCSACDEGEERRRGEGQPTRRAPATPARHPGLREGGGRAAAVQTRALQRDRERRRSGNVPGHTRAPSRLVRALCPRSLGPWPRRAVAAHPREFSSTHGSLRWMSAQWSGANWSAGLAGKMSADDRSQITCARRAARGEHRGERRPRAAWILPRRGQRPDWFGALAVRWTAGGCQAPRSAASARARHARGKPFHLLAGL